MFQLVALLGPLIQDKGTVELGAERDLTNHQTETKDWDVDHEKVLTSHMQCPRLYPQQQTKEKKNCFARHLNETMKRNKTKPKD